MVVACDDSGGGDGGNGGSGSGIECDGCGYVDGVM